MTWYTQQSLIKNPDTKLIMTPKRNKKPGRNQGTTSESLADVYHTKDRLQQSDRRSFLQGTAAVLGLGTVFAGTSVAQSIVLEEEDEVATATGENGLVSTSHPTATELGAQILEQEGNAIDVAVAIQAILGVVEPQETGLGGGGIMMVYIADENETYCLNSQVRAPAAATPDQFVDADEDISKSGLTVGAPGTIRGLDLALKRWGTFDLNVLLQPAITLAREGHPVDSELANTINSYLDRLSPAARSIFCEQGDPLTEGDLLIQEDLAETLERIAEQGPSTFYGGDIGQDIVTTVQEHGGNLTSEDLADYNASVEPPLVDEFNGYRITTAQPPSSGGLAMLSTLRLLEGFDLQEFDPESLQTWARVLEAVRFAYADSAAYTGDLEFVDVPLQGLLNDDYIEVRQTLLDLEETVSEVEPGDPWEFQPGEPYPTASQDGTGPGTSHFVVADDDGNIVSCTSTVSLPFGTGILVPDRGILLANSLLNFDSDPESPNEIRPQKRPATTMTPTLVFDGNEPLLATGSAGGSAIPSVVSKALVDLLIYDRDPVDMTAAPRMFSGLSPTLFWEDGISEETRAELADRGYDISADPSGIGAIQSLLIDNDGYTGTADARRDGATIGIPRSE